VRGGAERVVLEDSGHVPQRDRPEATLAQVALFVWSAVR
jgi:pimeloyl-ACP methyl ester carboxylesterase